MTRRRSLAASTVRLWADCFMMVLARVEFCIWTAVKHLCDVAACAMWPPVQCDYLCDVVALLWNVAVGGHGRDSLHNVPTATTISDGSTASDRIAIRSSGTAHN